MNISKIHSYLVHPSKSEESQPKIRGTEIAKSGTLYEMIRAIFKKSDSECNNDISFDHNSEGAQQNDFRDLLLAYLTTPSVTNGRNIAARLQSVTTHRSGLGLLFLIVAAEDLRKKIVVSRFPADVGVLAEDHGGTLTVEFVEKVFMKSAKAYKAALYSGTSFDGDFWHGSAVDKQIDSNVIAISNYWIKDFLLSDFRTTAAAGTRRLAIALREAANHTSDTQVKEEITAATKLAKGLSTKTTSIREFCQKFSFSEGTQEKVEQHTRNPRLFTQRFTFSVDEFTKHIAYRTVELDNGGILTAEASRFDNVFTHETIDSASKEVRYTTEGRIIDERLKRTKR